MTSSIDPSSSKPKVLLIGIGGPTCSGKTSLTKHLVQLLSPSSSSSSSSPPSSSDEEEDSPKCLILHQDDFAPPESSLIWNKEVESADWDDPDTSVDWTRMRTTVSHLERTGEFPEDHSSHDELNPIPEVGLPSEVSEELRGRLRDAWKDGGEGGRPSHIVFLDGFLLYYDEEVRSKIDVSVFVRIGRKLLQQRREARGGYVTADGDCWKDPPLYFSHILWPSHLKAHASLFQGQDVEQGLLLPSNEKSSLHLLEAQDPPGRGEPRSMEEMVREVVDVVVQGLKTFKARQ